MKHFIILGLLLVLVIGACTATTSDPTTTLIREPTTTLVQAPPDPTTPTSAVIPSSEVQALKEKANLVQSVKYTESVSKDTIFIKGDKAKRQLFETAGLKSGKEYDTIFLDNTAQKALAACTGSLCQQVVKKKYWDIGYEPFRIKNSPLDVMKEVADGQLDQKRSKKIDTSTTLLMNFKDVNGIDGSMWINTYYGVPHEATLANITYEYLNLVVNRVTDTDVIVPVDYEQFTE